MDPARRAASNHGDDDGEVHIVVDLSHQLSPNNGHHDRENSDANRRNGNRNRVLGIDLNGPAMKDFEAEYPDTPLPSPVADAPGQNYTGRRLESAFDGYIDWGRGSIDVAPDGRLAYYESAPAPVANGNGSGNGNHDRRREFDLNAAVQEAQNQDEAYYENRLENLRNGGGGGGDFQVDDDDQDLDLNFNNTAGEDQSVPLWYH